MKKKNIEVTDVKPEALGISLMQRDAKRLTEIELRMPTSLFNFYCSGDIGYFNGDVLETARVKAHLTALLKVVS